LEIQVHQVLLETKDNKGKLEYKGHLVEPDLLAEWETLDLLERQAVRANPD